jgi:hypothetical protein
MVLFCAHTLARVLLHATAFDAMLQESEHDRLVRLGRITPFDKVNQKATQSATEVRATGSLKIMRRCLTCVASHQSLTDAAASGHARRQPTADETRPRAGP